MDTFKTLEDKVTYVETLTCVSTMDEKVTESSKILIYNILSNYNLSEHYADRIWERVRQKRSLEDILSPMEDMDIKIKQLFIQELVMVFLASEKYQKEKRTLINVCNIFGINTRLEMIKEHVVRILREKKGKTGSN